MSTKGGREAPIYSGASRVGKRGLDMEWGLSSWGDGSSAPRSLDGKRLQAGRFQPCHKGPGLRKIGRQDGESRLLLTQGSQQLLSGCMCDPDSGWEKSVGGEQSRCSLPSLSGAPMGWCILDSKSQPQPGCPLLSGWLPSTGSCSFLSQSRVSVGSCRVPGGSVGVLYGPLRL